MDAVVKLNHAPVVLHVNLNLLLRLVVRDGEAALDLDFILRLRAEEGSDDPVRARVARRRRRLLPRLLLFALLALCCFIRVAVVSSQVVVEDGEETCWVDGHTRAGSRAQRRAIGGRGEVEMEGCGRVGANVHGLRCCC